jgi:predicted RNase H-like HicB family nuclease
MLSPDDQKRKEDMQVYRFTAQIERDIETGLYVGIVPDLPGAHTQAATLDELYSNLKEVVELCLEELTEEELRDLPEFVGVHQILVAKWPGFVSLRKTRRRES